MEESGRSSTRNAPHEDLPVGSRNFFGAAPRPRRADTLRPKAVDAMSRTVSSCISDDGIERINGVCWPNLASSVPSHKPSGNTCDQLASASDHLMRRDAMHAFQKSRHHLLKVII